MNATVSVTCRRCGKFISMEGSQSQVRLMIEHVENAKLEHERENTAPPGGPPHFIPSKCAGHVSAVDVRA